MGICSSCESTNVATAKLILDDGRLKEFAYPVKVSYVLQKTTPPCFICNSDEMNFDDVVSAVGDDDELQPGQLYFALPLSRLSRRLQAEDMAALAVKASSALTNGVGAGHCGCRRNIRLFGGGEKGGFMQSRRVVAEGGGNGECTNESRRRRKNGRGERRGEMSARLCAIPE